MKCVSLTFEGFLILGGDPNTIVEGCPARNNALGRRVLPWRLGGSLSALGLDSWLYLYI
jgi:hypothetical protein